MTAERLYPEELARALHALRGRELQLLELHLLRGSSRLECAGFLGVPPSSFDVLLLRATFAWSRALGARPTALEDDAWEAQAATQLRRWLEEGWPEPAVESRLPLKPVRSLLTQRSEVLEHLERFRAEEDASPRALRQARIRRVLVALLALGALLLYFRGGK